MKGKFLALAVLAVLVGVFFSVGASPWHSDRMLIAYEEENEKILLNQLLPNVDRKIRSSALRKISLTKNKRFIIPLVDLLRFQESTKAYKEVGNTIIRLSGVTHKSGEDFWEKMMLWVAGNESLEVPSGYTKWKGDFHAQAVDPRFREFLYEGAAIEKGTRVGEVVWGGVKVDGIPALVNPKMLEADQADYITDEEPVFGVSINGDSRAYPLRILDWHEMANDVVGGKPVALAYCTLCGAGILFDVSQGKQQFEFGSSGFLMRSNKLMYDRKTKTLWNQLTGKPVIGKLVGKNIELKVLPVVLTSWGKWKSTHPASKILSTETGYDRPYQVGATYGRYFASPKTLFPVRKKISKYPRKARIYAIQHDGLAKAYPLDELNKANGVANDTLGKKNLVVVYKDATGRIRLPQKVRDLLKSVDSDYDFEFANDLTLSAFQKLVKKKPEVIKHLTVEIMLAIPTEARLTVLNAFTPDLRSGNFAGKEQFSPNFRNQVAQRGLIGETRAYERGKHSFSRSENDDELKDEDGKIWKVTEDALVSTDGEKLKRLGGHLAFWFGWVTYFSQTEIYEHK